MEDESHCVTLSLRVVATGDVFNYISINSLWELLAEDCKIIFGNAFGEVDRTGALVARVCVARREKQLSVAATLVLFSAVSIRKILRIPRNRISKPVWCPCCCLKVAFIKRCFCYCCFCCCCCERMVIHVLFSFLFQ